MKLYPVIQTLLLLGSTSVYGQIDLSAMDALSTDSLQKSEIRYFAPGKGGMNRVWDISQKLASKASSQVMFAKDSAGVISIMEPDRNCYYHSTADTLKLLCSESPLEKRIYLHEKTSKVFPLEFGDSITLPFRCEGMYCGDHPFREVGTRTIKVDAVGSIVLAENDTVGNVKRVHTIDSYSICMDIDSAALDTAKLTQVIAERYEWFLPDSQYPILENVISTTYYNMDAIGTTKTAFCNMPTDKAPFYITAVDEDAPDEEDDIWDGASVEPEIIHYTVETRGGVVNITYDLDADATIATIVANNLGMVYNHREWRQKAGTGYSTQIDCNGLRSGLYILYINVNGKAYSEKVTL